MKAFIKFLLILLGAILLLPGACAVMMLPQLMSSLYQGAASDVATWLILAGLGAVGVWLINKVSRS